jgi:hypothetical protein
VRNLNWAKIRWSLESMTWSLVVADYFWGFLSQALSGSGDLD